MRISDLHPEVVAKLDRLERDLLAQGVKADKATIVQALIFWTPAPQTAGMISAFVRHMAQKG